MRFAWLILLVAVCPAQRLLAQCTLPPQSDGKDELCGRAILDIARIQRERSLDAQTREAQADTDITHVLLDLEITLSPNALSGTCTLDVTSASAGLTQLTLDLRSNMTVDAVTVNGGATSYARPGHQLVIDLDQTYGLGDSFQVAVTYHGLPAQLGFSNKSFTFDTHAGTPIVASLSQPFYAHTWWPCKEDNHDKFTLDMWVTTPNWMTVASNGALQGIDALSGSRQRTRWGEAHPIETYLVSLAATNYAKTTWTYNSSVGPMPVELYLYPEEQASVLPQVADLVQMIATLAAPDCFGEYPFVDEKYGIAQFEWCCGIEHQTITSQGTFPERRNVHEMAHSWWGDDVTCATWHDVWLNEGFARYAEALWHERKPGGSYAAYLSHLNTYRPSSVSGTVYRYDISTTSTIFSTTYAYNKGAWIMHMLRHVVGDANFFAALAAHHAAYSGRSADTEDFRASVEGVYGEDLGWFFDEWVYGPGAPSYRYGWQAAMDGGQHQLKLYVEQFQASSPYFAMPIDIEIDLSGGGTVTRTVFNEADDQQWFTLPLDSEPIAVRFDPDTWILRGAADLVAYVPEPPFGVEDAIVESRQLGGALVDPPAYLEFGDWASSTIKSSAPGLAGTGSRFITYDLPNTGSDHAVLVPTIEASGRYEVFVTWAVGANCFDARHTVRHFHGSTELLVDQIPDGVSGENANTWVTLGDYWFRAGQSEASASVDVSEETVTGKPHPDWNQRVYADAARWVLLEPWPPGDADADGDVDLDDAQAFTACMSGPATAFAGSICDVFDADNDGDVDLLDWREFELLAYSMP